MQINDKIELHHTIAAGSDGSTLAAFAHDPSQRYDIIITVSCTSTHELHM